MNTTNRPHPGDDGDSEWPRASRFVKALFRVIHHWPEVDRRLVFDALTARLLGRPGGTVRPLALIGLQMCAADLGQVPSRRAYDAWREALPNPDDYPHSSNVRAAFGNWRKATVALGAPEHDPRASRVLQAGGRPYGREQLIAALRACADALGKRGFYWQEYRKWSADRRQRMHAPQRKRPFQREFGSWSDALEAAGLDRHDEYMQPSHGRQRGVPYPREVLLESLRDAWADCAVDGHMTIAAYSDWVRTRLKRPGVKSIQNQFGSWVRALLAAGLIDEVRAAQLDSLRRYPITDEELLDRVRQAAADTAGGRFPVLSSTLGGMI